MRPLTQATIGKPRCETPGCDCGASRPMYLNPRCHRVSGTLVSYLAGVLTVRCFECRTLQAEIEVAKGDA